MRIVIAYSYDETNYKAVDRLDHPIREAQVDFGAMEVMHEDHMKNIQLLMMSFYVSPFIMVVMFKSVTHVMGTKKDMSKTK